MNWAKLISLTAAFLSMAGISLAQLGSYKAKETSVDIFASYLAPERGISHLFETKVHGGSIGGGLGVNHFLSPTLGMGTDFNIPNNGGSFVDSMTVNLMGRWPLGKSGLAPYLTAGGGRAYDPFTQWIGQAGIGLEYRSDRKSGFFVDARYVWGEKHSTDNLLLRAGLRVAF